MKKKPSCWRQHIGLSEELSFRSHEKELVMKLFEADLDFEISKAKKSHWIDVKAQWRNVKLK